MPRARNVGESAQGIQAGSQHDQARDRPLACHVQTTEKNYEYTVELLKGRFGKQDVLIQEHLIQFLNLPQVRALSDVTSLRRLHDHVHRNIAELKTLDIKSDSYRAMLCAALSCVLLADWAVDFVKTRPSCDRSGWSMKAARWCTTAACEVNLQGIVVPKIDQAATTEEKDQLLPLLLVPNPQVKGALFVLPSQCNATGPMEEKRKKLQSEGRCYRCARRGSARCLFNGGSQCSFVTKYLSRELKLEVIGKEEALEIKEICCDRLVSPDSVLKTSGLEDIELADVILPLACKITQAIEILVGADHHWKIVGREVCKLQGSSAA
ncbi:hypothetical protein HPB47_007047, partial [Ixodes persulcatus]